MTAIVQLLLKRQRQDDQASLAESPASGQDGAAQTIAKREVETCSTFEAGETSGAILLKRQITSRSRTATQTGPTANSEGQETSVAVPESPLHQSSRPMRSTAAMVQLAHALIAAHAMPQQIEAEDGAVAQFMRKPPVPRTRRKIPDHLPDQLQDSDTSGTNKSGSGPSGSAQPPVPKLILPTGKRPAWAQLERATPAQQEQALLDWVTSVDALAVQPGQQSSQPDGIAPV